MSKAVLALILALIFLVSGGVIWFLRQGVPLKPVYLIKWSEVDDPKRMVQAVQLRMYPIFKQGSSSVTIVAHQGTKLQTIKEFWDHQLSQIVLTYDSNNPGKKIESLEDRSGIVIYYRELQEEGGRDNSELPSRNEFHIEDSISGCSAETGVSRIDCYQKYLIKLNSRKIRKAQRLGFLLAQISPSEYLWLIKKAFKQSSP